MLVKMKLIREKIKIRLAHETAKLRTEDISQEGEE
jgi:hypothetical protein